MLNLKHLKYTLKKFLTKEDLLFYSLIGLYIFLRIYRLSYESLWTDEAFTVIFSKNSVKNIFDGIQYEAHPPFYYIIMHYVLLLGDSEFISRLPSAIAGIITILFTCKVANGRSLSGEILQVALFIGFSLSAIEISKMARMYSLECLLAVLCAYFVKKSLNNDKNIYWAGYVIASIILLYTHYTGFIFLFSVNIYYFIFWKETKKYIKKWVLCQSVIALLFLPWLPVIFKQTSAGYGELLPTPDMKIISDVFIHLVYGGLFSINYIFYPLILIPVIIIFYCGSVYNFNKRKNTEHFLPVILFLLPLFITLIISIFTHKKIFSSKHFFYSLPFFYIVMARGIEYIKNKKKFLAITLTLLWLSLNLYSLYNRSFLEKFQYPDWRGSVKQMTEMAEDGDLILVQSPFQAFTFNYYYRGNLPAYTVTEDNVPYDLSSLCATHKRIWLFSCQAWHHDPKNLVETWLQNNCKVKEQFIYFRIDRASLLTLTLYECPG